MSETNSCPSYHGTVKSFDFPLFRLSVQIWSRMSLGPIFCKLDMLDQDYCHILSNRKRKHKLCQYKNGDRDKNQRDVSKKQFRWLFAESLLEFSVSLTDKPAIPACNLFSTEYNQQNKHKIILLVADCCVGTWTAPNVPAAALFCFVCLFVSCCINGFYITFIIQWKYKKDHSGCVDANVVLWRNLAA